MFASASLVAALVHVIHSDFTSESFDVEGYKQEEVASIAQEEVANGALLVQVIMEPTTVDNDDWTCYPQVILNVIDRRDIGKPHAMLSVTCPEAVHIVGYGRTRYI